MIYSGGPGRAPTESMSFFISNNLNYSDFGCQMEVVFGFFTMSDIVSNILESQTAYQALKALHYKLNVKTVLLGLNNKMEVAYIERPEQLIFSKSTSHYDLGQTSTESLSCLHSRSRPCLDIYFLSRSQISNKWSLNQEVFNWVVNLVWQSGGRHVYISEQQETFGPSFQTHRCLDMFLAPNHEFSFLPILIIFKYLEAFVRLTKS